VYGLIALPLRKTVRPSPAEGAMPLGEWNAGAMLYIMGYFRKDMYNKNKRVGKNITRPGAAIQKII
jgi:hypothetical protein